MIQVIIPGWEASAFVKTKDIVIKPLANVRMHDDPLFFLVSSYLLCGKRYSTGRVGVRQESKVIFAS